MAGEVLSQSEVELLLTTAAETRTKETKAPKVVRGPLTNEKIITYDFKRPERVGK